MSPPLQGDAPSAPTAASTARPCAAPTSRARFHPLQFFFRPSAPWWPGDELSQDRLGRIYGVTRKGGALPGYGTVFRIDTDGRGMTALKVFTDGDDGGIPMTGPTLAPDGTLVGMTTSGGATGGVTLYRITQGD